MGCAIEFIADGLPVSTVTVPPDTADTPARPIVTVVALAPRLKPMR